MKKPTETILKKDSPTLRKQAVALTGKDIRSPEFSYLISHMKKLLAKEEHGVGLAAPQVGVSVRLFIVSGRVFVKPSEGKEEGLEAPLPADLICINPEIVRSSKTKQEMAEGCLSVPGLYGTVLRYEKATLRALDERGKLFTRHTSGLLAHIIQHETDHLDGILYIDKAVQLGPWDGHSSEPELTTITLRPKPKRKTKRASSTP